MDVILLEKVESLGGIGDQVKVKSGFGRNYLLPKGKALLATPDNVKKMEALRAELEAKASAGLKAAQERASKFNDLIVVVKTRVGPEGKLFGSVGPIDIADALSEDGHDVARSEIRLPDGTIRVAGDHAASLHLHSDVNVDMTIRVTAEDGSIVTVATEETAEVVAEAAEPAGDETAADVDITDDRAEEKATD